MLDCGLEAAHDVVHLDLELSNSPTSTSICGHCYDCIVCTQARCRQQLTALLGSWVAPSAFAAALSMTITIHLRLKLSVIPMLSGIIGRRC